MLDMVDFQAGRSEPTGHDLVRETETEMGVADAQFLTLMGGEIDDQERSARRQDSRRFGDRRRGCVRIVENLVDDDAVGGFVLERERVHVALPETRGHSGGFELHSGEAEHFRRSVDADRLAGARAEQLDHPAGAGADVDQGPQAVSVQRPADGALDLGLRDMERADRVPHVRLRGEVAGGGLGPVGAHGVEARRILVEDRAALRIGPGFDQRQKRLCAPGVCNSEEHPAAFLAAVDDPGIGEDADVP
jgi:hypothetical protein